MSELPADLIPLPTAPYPERPDSLPLEIEECRTAIWLCRGNVTEAAKLVKVTSGRLRKFIAGSAYLSAELRESKEQLADIAENVVYEALTDEEDKGRKDTMARFVLTNLGRTRGYGTAPAGVKINNSAGGTIVVQWADGTQIGQEPAPGPSREAEDIEEVA